MSKTTFYNFLFLATAAFFTISDGQYQTKIQVNETGNEVVITSHFKNNTDQEANLSYLLFLEKTGPSGTASNQQGGPFIASAGADLQLSTIAVNLEAGDQLDIKLQIVDDQNNVVAEDHYVSTKEKKTSVH